MFVCLFFLSSAVLLEIPVLVSLMCFNATDFVYTQVLDFFSLPGQVSDLNPKNLVLEMKYQVTFTKLMYPSLVTSSDL